MKYTPRIAKYKKKKWHEWRKYGCCGRCGLPTNINKSTGKPYSECFRHRLLTAERCRLMMKNRRLKDGNILRPSER
jgi:hypothetical protein